MDTVYPYKEGTIPFTVAGIDTPCSTYYKIIGDLGSNIPLVILHGGPGSGHEYMLPYAKLWTQHKIPTIFYDAVGCGRSTHLQHKAGDTSFWDVDLFIAELENLLDHLHLRDAGFDLLGHSFGGMIAAQWASRRPVGLRRLILASAISSVELWAQCLPFFMSHFPEEQRQAVEDTIEKGDFDNVGSTYRDAESTFRRTFWCRADPPPAEILTIVKNGTNDPTVRRTMYGPSVLVCNGGLQNWTCIPSLPQINVPVLVYNGEHDLAQDSVTAPFFEYIPRVRWVTLQGGSHMLHVESDELLQKILRLVTGFLREA